MELQNLEKSQIKAIFEVSEEEKKESLNNSFEKNVKKVKIDGFRPGKAPRHIFEKIYGVECLYEDAINYIINLKANEIFKDEELAKKICGQIHPQVETENNEDLDFAKPFKVTLTFDVYPTFELPQYKGLEVKKARTEVTAEELEAKIQDTIKKDAKKETKEEQVIAEGDYATFDFVGTIDGEEFEGGKAENYELKIGSKQFIPGFEDQMIGMKKDEVKDINVTFPENYDADNLAGKPAVFKVTVHEIKTETFPELTDEYVASLDIKGVTNEEELKASKKKELEEELAKNEKDRMVNELIDKVLDNTVVDMPESLIDNATNNIRSQYGRAYGLDWKQFLGYLPEDSRKKLEESTSTAGQRQALFSVVYDKILDEEKLYATKEEIEAEALEEANKTGKDKDELLKKNSNSYFSQITYRKFIDLLLANAVETE